MSIPEEFILPYIVSNLFALLLLLVSCRTPRISRVLYFVIFCWASFTNANEVLNNPGQYLDYAEFTFIPFYKKFIDGIFSSYTQEIVLFIAGCQMAIGLSMLQKGWIYKLGALGGMIFFLAIAPLGIGAAFPATIVGAIGLYMIFNKGKRMIWKSTS